MDSTSTEKLPESYYQWKADDRFPDLRKALDQHHENVEKWNELQRELATALCHIDEHCYAIRILDSLHDDFCYGSVAAGKKVNKFLNKYCGIYSADEAISCELLDSINVLREAQQAHCKKIVDLKEQVKVADEVRTKSWDAYHALDKKREAEFYKLQAAEKAAEKAAESEEVA